MEKYEAMDLNSNKRRLFAAWKEGVVQGANYFYLEFVLPNHPEKELIVNPIENVDVKLEYIDKTYGGDLVSVHNPEVAIVSFGYVFDMGELEYTREEN